MMTLSCDVLGWVRNIVINFLLLLRSLPPFWQIASVNLVNGGNILATFSRWKVYAPAKHGPEGLPETARHEAVDCEVDWIRGLKYFDMSQSKAVIRKWPYLSGTSSRKPWHALIWVLKLIFHVLVLSRRAGRPGCAGFVCGIYGLHHLVGQKKREIMTKWEVETFSQPCFHSPSRPYCSRQGTR